METINVKFDEEQLENVIKKVTENIINKTKEDSVTELTYEKLKTSVRMYLEANTSGVDNKLIRVYWGLVYNTFDSGSASVFNLEDEFDREEVEKLKKQGWKEEVLYK